MILPLSRVALEYQLRRPLLSPVVPHALLLYDCDSPPIRLRSLGATGSGGRYASASASALGGFSLDFTFFAFGAVAGGGVGSSVRGSQPLGMFSVFS